VLAAGTEFRQLIWGYLPEVVVIDIVIDGNTGGWNMTAYNVLGIQQNAVRNWTYQQSVQVLRHLVKLCVTVASVGFGHAVISPLVNKVVIHWQSDENEFSPLP
jgi:hypothetical protein